MRQEVTCDNLQCPECSRAYVCRLCHDDAEEHNINRFAVTSVVCLACDATQPKAAECAHCGQRFGKYSCLVCALYDDRDLGQFHCDGCRLCRVGGREKYTHCDTCCSCLPNHLANKHQCLPGASERQCPVCLEDIHSARDTAHVPSCHHFLHSSCYEQLIRQNISSCPVCGKSMFEMTRMT
ncbi:hypothetical protein HAZT_HAZT007884 [Hyalella azteca]|uniref:RING-type domain-containing protein n=1 Tax=Hyalella azteca TaxID=294128 RepID=A0A6A0H6K1_HYAAZ|nr:hypothetical protein HAZT_HAZT007884 [Hyalella azteca]